MHVCYVISQKYENDAKVNKNINTAVNLILVIMDRCIVEGCRAGLLNNKQNMLLKMPNDPVKLGKWCRALGQILQPGDQICTSHFKKENVLENTSTFEDQKTTTIKPDPVKIEEIDVVDKQEQPFNGNDASTSEQDFESADEEYIQLPKGQKRRINRLFSATNKLSKLGINPGEASLVQNKSRKTVYSYSPTKRFDCFDELKYIVQQRCIRQQWCAKVEPNSVFFSHVDQDLSRVNCCLQVAANFKVNAYTADKIIAIYVATTDGVKCVAEIVEIMKVLEKKRWCLGPGIPYVNRSPDCIGAMPTKSASDSCTACVKEKLDSLSHTRELANCRIKLEESRHKCELMRKKHHYINNQYERLKAENKILEFQVDEAKKIAINEVLDRLPILQQCVVRYIIHSSYTVKSALRYSDTWINECHTMRAMNPSLYEYMRQKEILPLPCLDTLRKHKIKPAATGDEKLLPESLIPDPLVVINAIQDYEIPVIAESMDTMITTETSEIPIFIESSSSSIISETITELPESTNAIDYDDIIIDIPHIQVAHEETVCAEEQQQEQTCVV